MKRNAAEEWVGRSFALVAAGVYIAVSLGVFHEALFSGGKLVLGGAESDVGHYFLPMHAFGFEQWKTSGHVPGWNPYVFSGTPFVANFQAGMWYPPNWLHLVMNHAAAINWIVAMHVALAGWAAAMWCRMRGMGIGIVGSLVGGVILMLSGGYLPRIILGHVTVLCASPWSVVIFLALEGLLRDRGARWVVLGIIAVGMSILAGHPQTTYCALMLAGIYTLIRLFKSPARWRLAGMALAMVIGGCLLAGVQLFPGWKLAQESIRGGGVGYEFSKQNSLPAENLLTLFDAQIFGKRIDPFYSGRGVFPETSVFIGAAGVVLAIIGAVGRRGARRWDLLMLLVISFVLALGAQTPVHWVLYRFLPGYSTFRGTIRFDLLFDLFLAVLAAYGADAILKGEKPGWAVVGVVAALAIVMLIGGAWLAQDAPREGAGHWAGIFQRWAEGSRLPDQLIKNAQCVKRWGEFISGQLMVTGAILALATACIALARKWSRGAGYALAALAAGEMLAATPLFVINGTPKPYYPTVWEHAIKRTPDERVMYASFSGILEFDDKYLGVKWVGARLNSNYGLWRREEDAYGYDPVMLGRYARFIAACQGTPMEKIDWTPVVWVAGEGFNLVRVNNVFRYEGFSPVVDEMGSEVPRVQIVGAWDVKPAEEILKVVSARGFELGKEVLLEESPGVERIANGKPGTAKVITNSSDEIEIEAETMTPGILLVSDAYAPGWEAQGLEGSAQKEYQVMPADYVLRGIPLSAGKHHLRLVYRAPGLAAGAVASLGMIVAILGAAVVLLFRWKAARARLSTDRELR